MARKILLADDSVTAQNMGRKILTDAGYEVVTVNNGSAALKKVAEGKPDLIVLDVYMPGYSGLEVCQRLKENRETARIPILLTVGKLEPFKPEEARRVKADAYVVKPFEASELLTALTRLEDKIVPQADGSHKPGRFAKAIAAFEEFSSETGERFGDAESGWKNRLRFPSGKKSEAEPEPEPPAPAAHAFRDLAQADASKPTLPPQEFERPLPAGLPADITPEEIAAITAAAARLSGKSEAEVGMPAAAAQAETSPEPAAATENALPAEQAPASAPVEEVAAAPEKPTAQEGAPPATLASAPEAVAESMGTSVAPVAAAEAAAPATPEEPQPAAVNATVSEEPPASAQAVVAMASAAETKAPEVPEATDSKSDSKSDSKAAAEETDAEVMAALQTLTPTGSNGEAHAPAASSTDTVAPPSMVAAVAAMEGALAGVPRWIAEPVALDPAEANCSLEIEMHKAFAAFAAADAARMSLSGASAISGSYVVPMTAEPAPASPSPAPVEAVSAEPAAVQVSSSDSVAPAANLVAPTTDSSDTPPSPSPATSSEQTPVSESKSDSREADDLERSSRHEEAIKAAAWANWHQIRDSIVGSAVTLSAEPGPESTPSQTEEPKQADQPADDQSAAPSEFQPEAMAAAASANGSTIPAPAPESGAIASIVDSVLAELRPKIVEEIAKKLGNEKKKK